MQTVLGTLITKMGLDISPLKRGMQQARSVMQKNLSSSAASLEKFKAVSQTSLGDVKESAVGLRDAFISLGGAIALQQYVSMVDSLKLVEGRLKLVTESAQELADIQEKLYKIAERSRSGFQDTASLYTRLARSTKELNFSQQQLLQVTETISKAMLVSGASAEEASRAMIQLSQGLAAGVLRGQDLRSVIEQTPRLAAAIAEGLGVTLGKLRELGEEGALSAEQVIRALLTQKDVIEKEYSQMPVTVSQAFTVLHNEIAKTLRMFDEGLGLTSSFAKAINTASEAIRALAGMSSESRAELIRMAKEVALAAAAFYVIPKISILFSALTTRIASTRLALASLPAVLVEVKAGSISAAAGMKLLAASAGTISIILLAAVEAGRALSAWFDSMNQLTREYKEGLERDVEQHKIFAKTLKEMGFDLSKVRETFGSLDRAMEVAKNSSGRLGKAWEETQKKMRELHPAAEDTGASLDELKKKIETMAGTAQDSGKKAEDALRKMYGVVNKKDVAENLQKLASDFEELKKQGVNVKLIAASMNEEFLKQLKLGKEYGIQIPDSVKKVADEIGKNGYPQVAKLGDALAESLNKVKKDASGMQIVIRNAAGDIAKTLSGGFNQGAQDGVKFADQQLQTWRKKIETEGILVPLKPDDSEIRAWLEQFKHGLGAAGTNADNASAGAVP